MIKAATPVQICRLLLLLSLFGGLSGCAGAIVGGLATGGVIATDERTLGATVEDQQIEMAARKLARNHPEIAAGLHLSFTSYNRVLLITGQVIDGTRKAKLDNLLRAIPNLRRIHNELMVAAPNSWPSRFSDGYLTAKVKSRLTLEKGINPNRFKVVSENGRVFLLGLCSRKDGDHATLVARKTAGVQSVVTLYEYLD